MEEEEKLLVTLTQLRDRLRKDEEERKERGANVEEKLKQAEGKEESGKTKNPKGKVVPQL